MTRQLVQRLIGRCGASESVRGLPEDPDAGIRSCAVARGAQIAAGDHPGTGCDDTEELGGSSNSPELAGGKSARAAIHHCSVG